MGYGLNLKRHLKEKGTNVRKIGEELHIPSSSLYATIKRDSSLRYDYAYKISQRLGIPFSDICRYEFAGNSEAGLQERNLSFPVRTFASWEVSFSSVCMLLFAETHKERNLTEEMLTGYYLLDEKGREEALEFLQYLKQRYLSVEKETRLKEKEVEVWEQKAAVEMW